MMSVGLRSSLLWTDRLWQDSWPTPVSVNGALAKLSVCWYMVGKKSRWWKIPVTFLEACVTCACWLGHFRLG